MIFSAFFQKRTSSKVAKDRLKAVLVTDRTKCSPDFMVQLKADMLQTLSKYVEVDLDHYDVTYQQDTPPILFANIPIRQLR